MAGADSLATRRLPLPSAVGTVGIVASLAVLAAILRVVGIDARGGERIVRGSRIARAP